MKSEHRFHSYVTMATVTVMYFVIEYAVPAIRGMPLVAPYVKPIGALLLSAGVYKLLASFLLAISKRFKFVKQHILGAAYLNGTWIGSFSASDNSVIYTVEHFEQTLSSLKVRGQAYRADGVTYAFWRSLAETVDAEAGVLTYTYECDKTGSKSSFQGIGTFQFERKDESSAPTRISGYSADLVDGKRSENTETKISDDLVPFLEAFARAKGS